MRPPRLRVRLTLLYGGLFLLAGVMLIFLMYFLVESTLPRGDPLPPRPSATATTATGTGPDSHPEEVGLLLERFRQLRDKVLDTFLRQSIIALAITTVAAVAFAWMIAGRVLRPLRRITETAQRVADRNLHERIALPGPPDELKELADTFDAMLERLDRAFDSQRNFVGNASHEMRTPLAINRTLLEVALTYGDLKPELQALHTTLLATNERSERMLDGLLTLARSENQEIKRRPVDLADAALSVANTGPEIPPYDVDELFEPFRRLRGRPGANDRGAGLGLSIVRSVARTHGGDAGATPRAGGGLIVRVRLPKAGNQGTAS